MGIYIKGMKTPEECEHLVIMSNGYAMGMFDRKQYEVVEVPEPHGNLIDSKEIQLPLMESKADEVWTKVAIDSTPTVIEAEG